MIVRLKPVRDYTAVRNAALRDQRISLKAKGLLGLLLSFPDDWRYREGYMLTQSTDGRDGFRAAMRELARYGYVRKEQGRNADGTLGDTEVIVTDDVRTVDGFTGDGLTVDGSTVDGESDTTKKEGTKTETTKRPQASTSVDDSATIPDDDEPGQAIAVDEQVHGRNGTTGATDEQPRRSIRAGVPADDVRLVFDAYNEHRGGLPEARVLNAARAKKIRAAVRDVIDEGGTTADAVAAMAVAAREVDGDPFWKRKGYGLDNLLAEQRFIAKAETAMSRGTTDRAASTARSIADAIRGGQA